MKKLALLLVLAAACRSGTTAAPATTPTVASGASATPRAAVDAFLRAVRGEDLQAMSLAWGTAEGPARDLMERTAMEQREVVMMCYFRHDAYRVVAESPVAGGLRNFEVELSRGNARRTTVFTTVPAKKGGWFVQKVEIEPVQDWCTKR